MILASIASWTILVNAEESARCHQIKRENIDMQERVSKQETIQENLENWCYQRKDNGDLFIYNGDTWLSENPDFLYVPLSPGVCPDRHVGMEERWLKDILGLPEAH
jgi:hypothetical protein